MRGNIALIDALAAFIIVLTISGLVWQCGYDYKRLIHGYIEKEKARAIFYEALFSGKVRWSDLSNGTLLPNGLMIKETPSDGYHLKFFLSLDGDRRVYFICKGG
ncbi:MAG: hypothetical protein H5T34_08140 [Candidatus Methanomethyliales bacterium]|nr:hypothetical protein [Candidatus Methanomethylicales archaeon]